MALRKDTANILIIDDEPIIRETLAEFLYHQGFQVITSESGESGLAAARKTPFDVVICDINLPGLDGLEVQERLARISPESRVILITAYATVETAVEAFQQGAADYLMKPIILQEVAGKIQRLLKQIAISRENQWLRRELNMECPDFVVGRSPMMQNATILAKKVGPTPSPVLIVGESGTGKELMARAIHRFAQAAKPTEGRFLVVNCSATPGDQLENQLFGTAEQPGAFQHAGAGTVFLDEIGELPLSIQAKVLRAIEQREIVSSGTNEPIPTEARVVAATQRDLQAEFAAGRFREDLLYRMSTVTIRLPALRDRREDIPELVERLVVKHARTMGKRFSGATREAMELLRKYPWAGNIRELDNTIQRAIILGDGPLIRVNDLPSDVAPQANDPSAVDDLSEAVMRFEKLHIERILRQTPDKKEAAKRLEIGLSSLYRKIEQYGIG